MIKPIPLHACDIASSRLSVAAKQLKKNFPYSIAHVEALELVSNILGYDSYKSARLSASQLPEIEYSPAAYLDHAYANAIALKLPEFIDKNFIEKLKFKYLVAFGKEIPTLQSLDKKTYDKIINGFEKDAFSHVVNLSYPNRPVAPSYQAYASEKLNMFNKKMQEKMLQMTARDFFSDNFKFSEYSSLSKEFLKVHQDKTIEFLEHLVGHGYVFRDMLEYDDERLESETENSQTKILPSITGGSVFKDIMSSSFFATFPDTLLVKDLYEEGIVGFNPFSKIVDIDDVTSTIQQQKNLLDEISEIEKCHLEVSIDDFISINESIEDSDLRYESYEEYIEYQRYLADEKIAEIQFEFACDSYPAWCIRDKKNSASSVFNMYEALQESPLRVYQWDCSFRDSEGQPYTWSKGCTLIWEGDKAAQSSISSEIYKSELDDNQFNLIPALETVFFEHDVSDDLEDPEPGLESRLLAGKSVTLINFWMRDIENSQKGDGIETLKFAFSKIRSILSNKMSVVLSLSPWQFKHHDNKWPLAAQDLENMAASRIDKYIEKQLHFKGNDYIEVCTIMPYHRYPFQFDVDD